MNSIPKQYLVFGVIIIILVVGAITLMMRQTTSSNEKEKKESVFEEPVEVIPTVDSSVKASLKGRTEAEITIIGVPDGTDMIEYELSYSTKEGSIEGVFGTIEVDGDEAEEEVTFGTCSSGVCRYHNIDGPVSGVFKFSGEFGEQILETEFDV
ncbi:MAG: hypothetical protein O3B87_00095 [bacterium]|nr:hypothetical protein [bacterium]